MVDNRNTKIFLLLNTLLMLGIPSFLFAQNKEFQIHAIAFYNLENLFHPSDEAFKFDQDFTPNGSYQYSDEIYQKKLQNMAFALSKIAIDKIPEGPAIIGVAEVENELVLQDLIQQPALKSRNLRFVHFDSPDSRGIDVALLYNPQYFRVISAAALPILLNQNDKKINTRDALYVIGILGSDTLHLLVNHWSSRYGGVTASEWKRIKEAEVNKQTIDSICKINPDAKIIVMGDFNDNPDTKSLTNILRTSDSKSNVKLSVLYNPFSSFYKNGLGTLVYKNNWFLFDQILISDALLRSEENGWQFYKAEIFNKMFLMNPFGKYKGRPHRSFIGTRWMDGFSDHFPVLIYLIKE